MRGEDRNGPFDTSNAFKPDQQTLNIVYSKDSGFGVTGGEMPHADTLYTT